nr:hypothetical protein [Tanacetum cinerariifolium]
VDPELDVQRQRGGEVVRCGRQVGLQVCRHQVVGFRVGQAVGDEFRQLGKVFRLAGERDEIHGRGFVFAALEHGPGVDRRHAAVPQELEVLAFVTVETGDAAVVGRAHDHVTRGQHLQRLSAGFPPDDAGFDAVQLVERAVHAFGCAQHFVHVGRLHAVGDEGEFQRIFGAFAQAAFAGKFLRVEEVGPRGRCGFQFVAVPRHTGVPDDRADPAVVHGFGDEVSLVADFRPVDFFVEPRVTTQRQ